MAGNRPGYCTQDLWWELSLIVEDAGYYPDHQVCGLVTDVRKCFNTLPRPLIYACARKCGIPETFLRTWFAAVNRVQRCFIVQGACSQPLTAVTGFPEGDPLSVCAMAVLNLVLHHHLHHQGCRGSIISYVDNWEAITSCPDEVLSVWHHMQTFANSADIMLDQEKSYMWATHPEHRRSLKAGPLKVKLDSRDLGGHMHYSRRHTMYTSRDRILSAQPLWGGIARSLAPMKQKLRLLPSVAWARCFYGVSIVSLGQDHTTQLRAKAMQSLKWNKKGANPMIQFSLVLHPKHDPGFYMVWDTLQAFRRRHEHAKTFAILDSMCSDPPSHPPPGPCYVLLTRLHVLQWSWVGDGYIRIHDGTLVDLLHCPKQFLAFQAAQAWALHVGSLWTSRDTFQGLEWVDRAFSMQSSHRWSDEQASIMRTAMNGTFFTRDKQYHSGKFESKQCPWCAADDSVYHRYWQCPHFQDLRQSISEDQRHRIMDCPPCTYLHGWFTHTDLDMQLAHCWPTLPTFTHLCEHPLQFEHDLHLFIDGGCHGPDCPGLKVGTWAVACADLEADSYVPLAQGFLAGRFHTSLRAEITAAIEAISIGCAHQKRFYIWTDNQVVFDRLREWIREQPSLSISNNAKDADLWMQLYHRTKLATSSDLLCDVLKVRSHQDVALYSDCIEQWAFAGNNFVDQMTNTVLRSMPPLFCHLWNMKCDEFHSRRALREVLHNFMHRVGERAISDRSSVHAVSLRSGDLQQSVQGDEVLERLSLAPLPRELPEGPRPKAIAAQCGEIFQWLQSLSNGDSVRNHWMTSYQLFAHYQRTTGKLGFCYRNRMYRCVSDPDDGDYTFILGARRFVALLKFFASHFQLPCEVEYRFPAGVSFSSWHRCISTPVALATVSAIDSWFAGAGIRNIKNVGLAFQSVHHFIEVS
eukprot:Skav220295  [mRNA]  locus=scaffold2356:54172:56919:- [translate_table: standard]